MKQDSHLLITGLNHSYYIFKQSAEEIISPWVGKSLRTLHLGVVSQYQVIVLNSHAMVYKLNALDQSDFL